MADWWRRWAESARRAARPGRLPRYSPRWPRRRPRKGCRRCRRPAPARRRPARRDERAGRASLRTSRAGRLRRQGQVGPLGQRARAFAVEIRTADQFPIQIRRVRHAPGLALIRPQEIAALQLRIGRHADDGERRHEP
ncbi:hypothetical protein F3J16_28330 [Burkholderia sp. Ap-962]|nr:hypothetical protein [Burkholderia sp. Ap-962]